MSQAYIGAIETHCPNATLVLDRFHVVKTLNEAVDEVRKEQWREANQADRKVLKGMRWLLYRHSSTRTREDTRNLKALDKAQPPHLSGLAPERGVRALLGIQGHLGRRALSQKLDEKCLA